MKKQREFLINLYKRLNKGNTFQDGTWKGENIEKVINNLNKIELKDLYNSYMC